jgi:predicted nucleic acid-binding protein
LERDSLPATFTELETGPFSEDPWPKLIEVIMIHAPCMTFGAYDAAYIALAEALGCELLTGDVKLKNATGHHATVIVSR